MDQATDVTIPSQSSLQPRAPALVFSIAELPPNIFAIVMATGIVSIAAMGAGWWPISYGLFALNLAAYALLTACMVLRWLKFRASALADYANHAKAPGFFTAVAGTCVLGNQCLLIAGWPGAALTLWVVGFALWCLLTYTILPVLMSGAKKPPLEQAISGTWLLAVVGTQAVSVLGSIVAPSVPEQFAPPLIFTSLGVWLVGSMLYIWLISLIFYRIVFLPLLPAELAPPYWINMGAMAISTLGGLWLIRSADHLPLLVELLPFLKGMTLLFWATVTWWIPLLLALGVWRHIGRQIPLVYEHGYWAAVFPLGMYTVCTQRLITTFDLPFLQPVAVGFAWLSASAWIVTFLGLMVELLKQILKSR